ncbi:hypothetical protein CIB48_g1531 [Xylaria polymorpha]|nr:hypothetical protein CIB48_g1531 [Xylaria polymorpha]
MGNGEGGRVHLFLFWGGGIGGDIEGGQEDEMREGRYACALASVGTMEMKGRLRAPLGRQSGVLDRAGLCWVVLGRGSGGGWCLLVGGLTPPMYRYVNVGTPSWSMQGLTTSPMVAIPGIGHKPWTAMRTVNRLTTWGYLGLPPRRPCQYANLFLEYFMLPGLPSMG